MTARTSLLRLLLPLLATACTDTTAASDATHADALPRFALEEEVRIGSVDDPDQGFSRIDGVDVDREGRVYVFEGQDLQLRVYAPDSRLLRTIGRRGEGPGEFQWSSRFGVVGDTVWTIGQMMDRRITLFDREGRVLSTGRPEGVEVVVQGERTRGLVLPSSMREDGLFTSDLAAFVRSRDPNGSGLAEDDTARIPLVLFDATGAVVDTLGFEPLPPRTPEMEYVHVGSNRYPKPRPPSAEPIFTTLQDGWLCIDRPLATGPDEGSFRVTRFGVRGDTLFSTRFTYRPTGYDDALLDSIAARGARRGSGVIAIVGGVIQTPEPPSDSLAVAAALRAAMDFPPFQPPVLATFVGDDGGLWLRREDNAGSSHRWIRLDPEGRPLGEVEVPKQVRVLWSSGDVAWASDTDDYGIPWLVRYRVVEAG